MISVFKGIKDDICCANWGWVVFWGCLIGWGFATVYISFVGYIDSKVYGLHGVCLILIIINMILDLTDIGNYIPITTIGPLSVAIPIVFSIGAWISMGPDVASLFINHPLVYLILSVAKVAWLGK